MSSDSKDNSRRKFLTGSLSIVGGTGVAATLWPFLTSMAPSAKSKAAGAPVKVDISDLQDGDKIDLIWRKKPIWVVKRTKDMLESINTNEKKHKDPLSDNTEQQPDFAKNKFRSLKPEILVLEGVCTHLGCNPAYNPDQNNFFCACHGSKFDLAGKVSNGSPAGANLKVPPYRFEDENTIIVGEMPKEQKIDSA
jgi:ubiquinol-cytochrome c reductase iron-sulfur subunit|tara:strand:+ start:1050 stop:1631 length:582 start_codon:yes stop_codon:yes gene_type:complete